MFRRFSLSLIALSLVVFSAEARDPNLSKIELYVERNGTHQKVENNSNITLDPVTIVDVDIRGFDRNGRGLQNFEYNPEVLVIGTDPNQYYSAYLERLDPRGQHYRLFIEADLNARFFVRIFDRNNRSVRTQFSVLAKYTLAQIKMYLEDEGFHRYLTDGETVTMEPDGTLTFEVRGFDDTGRQLDKFSFDPKVTVRGGDHSYVRLEKLPGLGLHYRLIADGHEHDRFEVVVHDHSRHDLEKRFYIVSRHPVRPVSRLEMYRDGTEPLRYGETVFLEEGSSLSFTIRGFDDRGRQLRKDQFAPVVELRNYSGDPKDAYLEIQAGNEHAYRLYFQRERPELGRLQVAVWDRDGRLQPQSVYVTTRMPEPPQNPQIKVTQSDNDPAITSIRFRGVLEDFAGDVTGQVEATHPRARAAIYSVKVQNGQFLTDRISLPSGGITTIKLVFRNRLGDQIVSEGYARNGISGFEGFKSTTYERGR